MIDVSIDEKDLIFEQKSGIAPIIVASFDIECSSSHGDFPLAKKNYKKLAFELYDIYHKKMKTKEFSNQDKDKKIDFISDLIIDAFNHEGNDVSKVFVKEDEDLPDEYIINKVSERVYNILIRQETYKILALDLLKNYVTPEIKFIDANKKQYKTRIVGLIEDCFCDNPYNKSDNSVSSIYTKTNKKPSKKIIEDIASKCNNQLFSSVKKIKTTLKEIDTFSKNTKDELLVVIRKILYSYHINENEKPEIKIDKISEKFEISKDESALIVNSVNLCVNALYSHLNEHFPEIDASRDSYCKRITKKMDDSFPDIEGDKVIQIGTTVRRFGEKDCFLKHIITLGTCSDIDGAVVEHYQSEEEVLLAWTCFIQKLDPDIITGYNIFGFDFSFMWHRAEELNCVDEFSKLGRINTVDKEGNVEIKKSRLECKKLVFCTW